MHLVYTHLAATIIITIIYFVCVSILYRCIYSIYKYHLIHYTKCYELVQTVVYAGERVHERGCFVTRHKYHLRDNRSSVALPNRLMSRPHKKRGIFTPNARRGRKGNRLWYAGIGRKKLPHHDRIFYPLRNWLARALGAMDTTLALVAF